MSRRETASGNQSGPLKFGYRGTAKFSDGRTCGLEFEGEATTGTLTLSGKIYEWS